MIIDGNTLAREIIATIKVEVSAEAITPRIVVFTCEPTFETKKFLSIKKRLAIDAGIALDVIEVPVTTTLEAMTGLIAKATETADSIVIQLPFPHLDTDALIALIPLTYDADVFSYVGGELLPPVIGAIDEIARRYRIEWSGRQVVIVGQGRLVGKPAVRYVTDRGAEVTIVTKETFDEATIHTADILILGAGVSGLITPAMVAPGVVVLDAGTSEMAGQLTGDADPEVALVASLFTPVPGGIGPVAVAKLLENVLKCARMHRKRPARMV